MKKKIKIAIFGSSSNLGIKLSKFLISKGYIVRNISRNHKTSNFNFCIGEEFNKEILHELDKIIFVAHDFKNKNYKFVGDGIKNLIKTCKEKNIDILYISSTAANKSSTSIYGRSKYYAEQIVSNSNGIIIIPGLIFGDSIKVGLIPKIKKISKFSILIPYISNFRTFYYITEIEYLLATIEKIMLYENSGKFLCAYEKCLNFRSLISLFSIKKFHFKIPIPYYILEIIIKIFIKLNLISKRYLESFYNLKIQRNLDGVNKTYLSKKI